MRAVDALRSYLAAKGMTATDLATRLGVRISTITRLLNGERGPSLSMALDIEKVTRGAVPVKCWPKRSRSAA